MQSRDTNANIFLHFSSTRQFTFPAIYYELDIHAKLIDKRDPFFLKKKKKGPFRQLFFFDGKKGNKIKSSKFRGQ